MKIGMPFRAMVEHMLAINGAVEGLVVGMVITAHAWDVEVVEDDRFQKLVLIGLTLSVDYLYVEGTVQRMALYLEEDRIESYAVLHHTYVGYLNDNHVTTLS